MNSSEKILCFLNAHIPVIRYLDTLQDPRDSNLDIPYVQSLYQPLGKSYFDDDRNYIGVSSETYQTRPYPLEIIRKHFPQYKWTLEEDIDVNYASIKQYSSIINKTPLQEKCLTIMAQCKELHAHPNNTPEIRDALWFYHACFIDTLIDPNEYPFDNRVFTAYDLPNTFHILMGVPMWGEQVTPTFSLGRFITKSLPFAGARRTLINKTDVAIDGNEAFWNIFRCLFHCLLMDMYPEHLGKTRDFNLERLLRARDLSCDKKLLQEALSRKSFEFFDDNFNKENDKGCYIVFTAFRMWIIMLAHNQHHFQTCIDWKMFEQQTIEMASTIRNSNLFDIDPFSESREILSKGNKNPKTKVYRYRKSNITQTILDRMMEKLEKDLYNELESWNVIKEESLDVTDTILTNIKNLDIHVPTEIKENIINTLMFVPRTDWMTPLCMSIMRVPKYGGITEHGIYLMTKMIDIYYENAKPKDFEHIMSLFEPSDFKIITWYLHVVSILNKIDFELLTKQQVSDIDHAMKSYRYVLFPQQPLSKYAYDIFFTVCCQKINTLMGSTKYGHKDIAYDPNRNIFICAKTHKKINAYKSDDFAFSDFEKQRKKVRNQRKDFNKIPCKDNPVLKINLKGYMLLYNKEKKYLHCPCCGAFHKFEWSGYYMDKYYCQTCLKLKKKYYYTCHVCSLEIPENIAKTCNATIIEPFSPNGTFDIFQRVYFCKKHMVKKK